MEILHILHRNQYYGFLYTQAKNTLRYYIHYALYCDSLNKEHHNTCEALLQNYYSFLQH